ncbi:uncharacterized protein C17orf78 homolog [Oxyura jamaicensis]|uniref:uncharacterized protein C17orf78 homolog n=1 Tax=Oxyura jamaicensis TaxID=8884 RepID=UPI0015A5D8CC|nr:uncharacterized protein C17orf78 homolog [Oxyura jamaicensis]
MVTILIFSLVFAHTRLIGKDLGDYKCHVENASATAGHIRSLDVFLQAPGIAATKGTLSRSQKVSTLECFSHRSPVQVNLLHLEKMLGDLAEQAVEKCTLQSIEVITTAVRAPALNHSCVLLTPRRRKLHRKFILRGKVFLPGISNRAVKATLLKRKVFTEAPTTPPVHHKNQTSQEGITPRNDKDLLIRQKISIFIKLLIVCILLVTAICYMVIVICEIPCSSLCSAWMACRRSSSGSTYAASEPVGHQTGTLLTQLLEDTKEKSLQCFV